MTQPRDTTELPHTLLAKLDHDEDNTTSTETAATLTAALRILTSIVDALDQRLKALEERGSAAP